MPRTPEPFREPPVEPWEGVGPRAVVTELDEPAGAAVACRRVGHDLYAVATLDTPAGPVATHRRCRRCRRGFHSPA